MRKEVWFGLSIMAMVVIGVFWLMPAPSQMTNGHLGLLMLALIVVAIMLGFPTAFTLMGMGVMFAFLAYYSADHHTAARQTLDLMVQRAYSVMSNDVLISIPLFVFMGYLVERSNLIEKLFKSLHLALARIPGSLAVATLVTCAVFATATGIVGAVVTLMGLLAFPAMLRAGYNVKISAGVITAGGCLGILIPPSVMLIVYGATAGVSVVQLYAGAFFPGIMLAGLYIAYVMLVAKLKPSWMPPLPEAERRVELTPAAAAAKRLVGSKAVPGLFGAMRLTGDAAVPTARRELFVALLPAIAFAVLMGLTWHSLTKPDVVTDMTGVQEMGIGFDDSGESASVREPSSGGLQEPPSEEGGLQEPPRTDEAAPAAKVEAPKAPAAKPAPAPAAKTADAHAWERIPAPNGFWITAGIGLAFFVVFYLFFTLEQLEVFKLLLASFFPLAILILAVLGSIVFGLATPTEAAAVGSFGGFVLAAVYALIARPAEERRRIFRWWLPLWIVIGLSIVWFILFQFEVLEIPVPRYVGWASAIATAIWCVVAVFQVNLFNTVRESVFLTAKTSAMVCWLFVGSSIFSAAFALLGGQEVVNSWVLSMELTPIQFMILAQIIIFLLGWPLEWTEIIVIFMPIFIPLLMHFQIDPLFFGLLVALNLQTAFLSPPVAMAAFYLKGVSPPHVTLNAIFAGMMPFMAIQVIALALLYIFPGIGLWLPSVLYK
ncbi:MAG TPA: TRAP transporter large permease subunit [Casimicrobiaceae bacterium]|jgi:TRAP-type mannitol/chloroaromatic compound transport system permease large subunit|nr:TRAP transporter large permease subunit [Casimicrobiaceae bacterium]